MLPPVMKKNADCKKTKKTCSKLKNKCSEALGVAIGDSQNAKKCKKALKDLVDENVDKFCPKTCKTCGKFDLIPIVFFILCYHLKHLMCGYDFAK